MVEVPGGFSALPGERLAGLDHFQVIQAPAEARCLSLHPVEQSLYALPHRHCFELSPSIVMPIELHNKSHSLD
jgi:hypothetical protein